MPRSYVVWEELPKSLLGKVLRRAAVFGARKLASDDPSQRTDERVVEVVVAVDEAPLLIGQRVLVKFMKPGQKAGVARPVQAGVGPAAAASRGSRARVSPASPASAITRRRVGTLGVGV